MPTMINREAAVEADQDRRQEELASRQEELASRQAEQEQEQGLLRASVVSTEPKECPNLSPACKARMCNGERASAQQELYAAQQAEDAEPQLDYQPNSINRVPQAINALNKFTASTFGVATKTLAKTLAKALYDYPKNYEDDVSLTTGDKVEILEEREGGWTMVKKADGKEGLVPTNYIEPEASTA